MKLETPVCFFIVFYDWVISQAVIFWYYLLLSLLKDGIHSDNCFLLSDLLVLIDANIHLVLIICVIQRWEFGLITFVQYFFNWGNLKDCVRIWRFLCTVVEFRGICYNWWNIYVEAIDFLPQIFLWHFLGTKFNSWLSNLSIRETA